MSFVGVEYDGVLGWREMLAVLQGRLGDLFERCDTRQQASLYLEGLLSAAERKNGWQLANRSAMRVPGARSGC